VPNVKQYDQETLTLVILSFCHSERIMERTCVDMLIKYLRAWIDNEHQALELILRLGLSGSRVYRIVLMFVHENTAYAAQNDNETMNIIYYWSNEWPKNQHGRLHIEMNEECQNKGMKL
jgi:hypothetical protein